MHGLFLDLVGHHDWGMAHDLHAARPEKPFTVSPLQGDVVARDGRVQLARGKEYWFRVTSIDANLSALLIADGFAPADEVEMLDRRLVLRGLLTGTDQDTWCRTSTFEQLYDNTVAGGNAPPKRIQLRFYSPTTFRSQGGNLPLPVPRLVFLHLSQKWNAFAPIHLGDDIAEVIGQHVSLSDCRIATRMADFGSHRQVGFVGECSYVVRRGDEMFGRVCALLADFAFFSGVGAHTTMGMGQVARLA